MTRPQMTPIFQILKTMFMCGKLQELGEDLSFKMHRICYLMSTYAQNLSCLHYQHNVVLNGIHFGDRPKLCILHLCVVNCKKLMEI
jgi:hypothetical protein